LAALEAGVNALKRGRVIVYPTETLYGLGVDVENEAAIRRLIEVKGREEGKPVSLLVADVGMLGRVAGPIPEPALRLIRAFWPGPLTIVLPASEKLSSLLTGPKRTVGVRISSHPVSQWLVEMLGRPITTTSANPAGETPARNLEEAKRYFGTDVAVYIDGGELGHPPGSTVIEVWSGGWRMVREGAITRSAIENVLISQ
jgi:L-threonylcarbamoyladenylate synthase